MPLHIPGAKNVTQYGLTVVTGIILSFHWTETDPSAFSLENIKDTFSPA